MSWVDSMDSKRSRIAMTLFKRYDAKEIYAYFLKAFHEKRFVDDEFKNLSQAKETFFAILSPHNDLEEEFRVSFLEWIGLYVPKKRLDRCLATLRQIRANRKNEVQSVKLEKNTYIALKSYADFHNLSIGNAVDHLLENIPISQKQATSAKNEVLEAFVVPEEEPTMAIKCEDYPKTIQIKVEFVIENNSKFVRGKKKSIEMIELLTFSRFWFKKSYDGCYTLEVDYGSEDELKETIDYLYSEIPSTADLYDCFIDMIDISRADGEPFSFEVDEEE